MNRVPHRRTCIVVLTIAALLEPEPSRRIAWFMRASRPGSIFRSFRLPTGNDDGFFLGRELAIEA